MTDFNLLVILIGLDAIFFLLFVASAKNYCRMEACCTADNPYLRQAYDWANLFFFCLFCLIVATSVMVWGIIL